jgi:TonB-dependent receptor
LHFTDVQNTDFTKGQYYLNSFYNFKNGGYRWAIDESKYDPWLKLSRLGWTNAFEAADSWQNDWSGAEQFSAGYLMGTFNVGQKLTVLGGARFESYNMIYHAQFTWTLHNVMGNAISTANGSIGDTVNPVSELNNVPYNTHNVDRTDNNVFPGVQAQYKFNDWSDMRVAYTTGISRPNYTQIIPKIQFENGTFNVGNPLLKPSTVKNYDIMGTIHDNTLGLFSVGLFYKEIKNSTFGAGVYFANVKQYSDLWLPDTAFMMAHFGIPIPSTQTTNLTLNNQHLGYIRGIEIDWQTNFWYLPRPFSALVLDVNYTKSSSSTQYTIIRNVVTKTTVINPITGRPQQVAVTTSPDTTFEGRLTQQPNDVVNVALGIDYKGFSGRMSFRMTGNVMTSVGGRPEDANYTGNVYGWDFSLKQNLPIEGLSIALNGTNIFHNGINYYRRYRLKPDAEITDNLVSVLYAPTTFELNVRYSL